MHRVRLDRGPSSTQQINHFFFDGEEAAEGSGIALGNLAQRQVTITSSPT